MRVLVRVLDTQSRILDAHNPRFTRRLKLFEKPGGCAGGTPNADMNAGPEELAVIRAQFARFGSVCRTFAPLYRQVTLTALRAAIGGAPMNADRALGYGDVVAAWNHYLDMHNDGRGVVLIGHSQGAGVLTELLRREIEGTDAQELLVSVQLIGTRLAVPPGEDVGGALETIPLCRAADQTGCVISFASFRDEIPPPDSSRFGRIGGPGSEDMAGMDAACTNPAALAGGRGQLHAYLAAGATGIAAGSEGSGARWLATDTTITTPFVKVPGLLSAECVSDRGFNWFAVRTHADPADPRTDRIGGDVVGPEGQIAADWGLHLIDMHLAMGNLVDIVGQQGEVWMAR